MEMTMLRKTFLAAMLALAAAFPQSADAQYYGRGGVVVGNPYYGTYGYNYGIPMGYSPMYTQFRNVTPSYTPITTVTPSYTTYRNVTPGYTPGVVYQPSGFYASPYASYYRPRYFGR
jgi:hypothetical protein